MFSPSVRNQLSRPYEKSHEITVLYLLAFTFLDRRGEGKGFKTEF
jgi:hypothetical protein